MFLLSRDTEGFIYLYDYVLTWLSSYVFTFTRYVIVVEGDRMLFFSPFLNNIHFS